MERLCVGDDGSDFSDLSDDGDEEFDIGRQSNLLTEDDDDEDEGMIECESSPAASSSVDHGRWRKKLLECSFPTFCENFAEVVGMCTPLDYFKKFVTADMLLDLVQQTNLYSVQKWGDSVAASVNELEQYIGIYLQMGIVSMPSVRCYWESGTRYA